MITPQPGGRQARIGKPPSPTFPDPQSTVPGPDYPAPIGATDTTAGIPTPAPDPLAGAGTALGGLMGSPQSQIGQYQPTTMNSGPSPELLQLLLSRSQQGQPASPNSNQSPWSTY